MYLDYNLGNPSKNEKSTKKNYQFPLLPKSAKLAFSPIWIEIEYCIWNCIIEIEYCIWCQSIQIILEIDNDGAWSFQCKNIFLEVNKM